MSVNRPSFFDMPRIVSCLCVFVFALQVSPAVRAQAMAMDSSTAIIAGIPTALEISGYTFNEPMQFRVGDAGNQLSKVRHYLSSVPTRAAEHFVY
ncbi:MAG: hypothetical protein ACJ8OJ_20300 [Povalibacter sp.]